MTSASSGRTSKYYYYHCKSSCKHRVRAEVMHKRFNSQLQELKPLPEYFEKFASLIHLNYDNHNKLLNVKRIREIQSIEMFTDRIHKAKNLLLDGHFEFQDYIEVKSEMEAKIRLMGFSMEANSKKQIALLDKIEEASKLFNDLGKFINMLEPRNRNAFITAILEPNHNCNRKTST
jgi:site-specific DNA recombinase